MPNHAHATIIGHLGRDVEVRYLPSGDPIANCSVATTRKRKDSEVTTWWRVSLFGKRAEILAQYAGKGDPIMFSGEPCLREWTDKEGGKRLSLELEARDFVFLRSKSDGTGEERPPRTPPAVTAPDSNPAAPWDDSDVPF
jgi:single-strand DNA-binding protein